MSVKQFKSLTSEEYMRRLHNLTLKVLALAFLALILITSISAGALYVVSREQTKQIQAIFSSNFELETTRTITQGAATNGDGSPVKQSAGK